MKFLITRTEFDSMENRIDSAVYEEVVGYTESNVQAIEVIEHLKKKSKPYQGWNGQTYPQFTYTTIDDAYRLIRLQPN